MLKNVDPLFGKFLGTPLQVLGTRIIPEVIRTKTIAYPDTIVSTVNDL